MTHTEPVLTPRAQRFPFNVPISYRKIDEPHWHDCKTINVSRSGILFHSKEPIPASATLDIRVLFPLGKTLYCQGTLVRAQKSEYAVRIYHSRIKDSEVSAN